jgi:hypothetical protein
VKGLRRAWVPVRHHTHGVDRLADAHHAARLRDGLRRLAELADPGPCPLSEPGRSFDHGPEEVSMMSSTETARAVPSQAPTGTSRRRSWPGFLLAGLLLLTSAATVLLGAAVAAIAVTASIEAAAHGQARGLTVSTHPDPWFVYTEDDTPVTGIIVTAPDGRSLPVTLTSEPFTYGPHRQGLQVGTFQVPPGNNFPDHVNVVVTAADGRADVPIAVTTFDVASFNRAFWWVLGPILAVNVGVAVTILFLMARAAARKP